MTKKSKLTDKQARFCEEYLVDFNASGAYKRAGYAPKTAWANGPKMLINPNVQAYLSILRKRQTQGTEITIERTLAEISRVAFGDVTQVLSFTDSSLTLEDSKKLPSDITSAIETVTFQEVANETGTVVRKSVKMHNKMAALGLLADYFGIRDDFNKAKATLKRYGIDMVENPDSPVGWSLEPYVANRSDTAS